MVDISSGNSLLLGSAIILSSVWFLRKCRKGEKKRVLNSRNCGDKKIILFLDSQQCQVWTVYKKYEISFFRVSELNL